ncbi:E3 ubiquitin/ISG15 ligase TRIM25-like [Chanos chanos]|uniref:E3 ubiquitin/ISG15 ligase TRIM25-like n=1 Tax=Chanos chanos TaxID=29144 RepID=A0A6J2WB42_CHACN|nr:E3 ubiquitin/ISG15 ligase TRIM25-like [Chanos chanos]
MAKTKISVDEDQLSCVICLNLLNEPVTIPCGHNYCMDCIDRHWNKFNDFNCPQCRVKFGARPTLNKNTVLADVVERVKKKGFQAEPAQLCKSPGDVACDICNGKKRKASMSCLVCLASYCDKHAQTHYGSPALKRHKLIKASTQLQEHICPHHDKLLEMYCRTDQKCICLMCPMDGHKNHDTVSVAVERIARQAALRDNKRIFKELIQFISKRQTEVEDMIKGQGEVCMRDTKELSGKLQLEIAQLRETERQMEQLTSTDNHIHFLKTSPAVLAAPTPVPLPNTAVKPQISFAKVTKSVCVLKEKVAETLKNSALVVQEPHTREQFLKYACQLTLDSNTVNGHLTLSEYYKKATWTEQLQSYPDHPERFQAWPQVLCAQGLTGRCYWEVNWKGPYGVGIAVSYKGITRNGPDDDCVFGFNDKSWSLLCSPQRFTFWHSNEQTEITIPKTSRIGVFLDHNAGTLSFYSVSETMKLLQKIQTTFTEPLYPGFRVFSGCSATLCSLGKLSAQAAF